MSTLLITMLFVLQNLSLTKKFFLQTMISFARTDLHVDWGGVLIAIKDSIPASVISSIPSNHAPEIITVRLNLRKTTILSCVYLPPSPSYSNMNDAISNLTQITDANPSADTIFVGDFNLPDVQWDTLSSTSCAFCDFVFDNSLTQLINHSTHIQGNILNLVLSNSIDCVVSLTVANDNNWIATDHFTVTFQLSQQTELNREPNDTTGYGSSRD